MPRQDAFIDHLAQVSLFSSCSQKELRLIARRADRIEVETGRQLISEGSSGHEFFIITAGTAKVTRNGRKVAELGPGSAFGELALLVKAARNATVTAQTPLEVVVIGQREFSAILDEVPGIARKLLTSLATRLREEDARAVH